MRDASETISKPVGDFLNRVSVTPEDSRIAIKELMKAVGMSAAWVKVGAARHGHIAFGCPFCAAIQQIEFALRLGEIEERKADTAQGAESESGQTPVCQE
jgi:hypothetical protein